MHSFHPDFFARLSFTTARVAALGEARGRQELFVHQQPERLESLRQVAAIESTESSNRIEGVTAPRHRIEALVLTPTAPRGRFEQVISGYRDALSLVHESHARTPFSVNVVQQLYGMLYRYLQPTPAVQTPGGVAGLVQGYQRAAQPPALQPLVGVLSGGRGTKRELVREAILRRLGPFAIFDIERDCPGVSRELVRSVLRQLRDEGMVEIEGQGRGTKWRASERPNG